MQQFYNKWPEYEMRNAQYDTEEEMMQQLAISQIWDRLSALDPLAKDDVIKALAEDFETDFLNTDTRNYNKIPLDTLLRWSKTLDGYAPEGVEGIPIEFSNTPEQRKAFQAYMDARNEEFPWLSAYNGYAKDMTPEELAAYHLQFPQYYETKNWKYQYAAEHPEIIPLILSEEFDADVLAADEKTQLAVVKFRAERSKEFPDYFAATDYIYSLPEDQRDAAYKMFPFMDEYQSWKNEYLKNRPELVPYVETSDRILSAPKEIQPYIYHFYSEKNRLFAGVAGQWEALYAAFPILKAYSDWKNENWAIMDELWAVYWSLPEGSARRDYYNSTVEFAEFDKAKKERFGNIDISALWQSAFDQFPMVEAYMQWQDDYFSMFPDVEPYIKTQEEQNGNVVVSSEYAQKYNAFVDLSQLDPIVVKHMESYFVGGEALSDGARIELYSLWEDSGQPFGSFIVWLEHLRWMFVKQ